MSNLVVYQPQTLDDTMRLGAVLAKSGFFSDAKQEAQAVVKVLAGAELGFGPVQSMNNIHIINGRIAIAAHLMANAVKRSRKYNYRVLRLDDTACEIEFLEQGQGIGVSSFTAQDARKAGTKNMDKFPRNMLFARAMSNGVKWYTPDIFSGVVYTPEELGSGIEIIDSNEVVALTQSIDTDTGEIQEAEVIRSDDTSEIVEEYYRAMDRVAVHGLTVGALSGDVSVDMFGPATKKINQHVDLWERFEGVLVPAAEEMGVLDSQFDLDAHRAILYQDLLAAAKKIAEDIKAPVRERMSDHAPKSNKIEDWLMAWRELNGEAPF